MGSEAGASSTWRATKERGSRAPWSEGPSAGPIKGRSGNVGAPDRLLAGRDQGQVKGATRHRCLRLPQRDEQGAHDGEAVTFPVSATGVEPFPARRVGVSGPALKRLPSAPHPPKPNRSHLSAGTNRISEPFVESVRDGFDFVVHSGDV